MSVSEARSRLAHESKRAKRKPDPAAMQRIDDARRDLAEAKIKQFVEKVLACAPPLTAEQKARLAALLRSQDGLV